MLRTFPPPEIKQSLASDSASGLPPSLSPIKITPWSTSRTRRPPLGRRSIAHGLVALDDMMRLRRKGLRAVHAIDSAQQKLQCPKRRRRGIHRNHVARVSDADICKSALRDECPGNTGCCRGARGCVAEPAAWNVEWFRRRALEADLAAPCHVLKDEKRAVGDEDEVERAMGDYDVLGRVDDMGEDGVSCLDGIVAPVCKDGCMRAGAPGAIHWGVDGLLDLWSVKVLRGLDM